jgi:hypothetical protein
MTSTRKEWCQSKAANAQWLDKLTGICLALSTKLLDPKHHHLALPPTNMRNHYLVVAVISRFVRLACGLNIRGTQHRWGKEQQPHERNPYPLPRGSHWPDIAAEAHQSPSGPDVPVKLQFPCRNRLAAELSSQDPAMSSPPPRAGPEISEARAKLKFWAPLTTFFNMYEMMKNKYF